MFILYIYVANISLIPKEIVLLEGEELNLKKMFGIQTVETAKTSNNNYNVSNLEVNMFGSIPLKDVKVTVIDDIEVVPIGKIIGLKLYTNGVLVVGMSEIEDCNNNLIKPYQNTDIKEGDTILKINENEIQDIDVLKEVVNKSEGENLKLTILRDGSILTSNITPVKTDDKEYKLGLWVKDAATGVGTMTYYEPNSKSFAVLGHGITDSDTNNLINIESGELVTSKVISIKKGEIENPGEIKGTILNQQTIGRVSKNTQFGIYGTLDNLTSLNIDTSKKMKVALRDEIKIGEAKIICSLDNSNKTKEYRIEIEKIYYDNDYNNKSMLIRVTDSELIDKTGGIIRGLSGAPIIQNGKFIGAVTNVLVSNPEIGYAIFGDLMVKEMTNM
ncbi:MAG TPA: SpoIVB peptidase [Candidatus Scatovivens faecipullorum]|nr:SpoIVB peptidase [Candidatus Scatovivens faecipullorum]